MTLWRRFKAWLTLRGRIAEAKRLAAASQVNEQTGPREDVGITVEGGLLGGTPVVVLRMGGVGDFAYVLPKARALAGNIDRAVRVARDLAKPHVVRQ